TRPSPTSETRHGNAAFTVAAPVIDNRLYCRFRPRERVGRREARNILPLVSRPALPATAARRLAPRRPPLRPHARRRLAGGSVSLQGARPQNTRRFAPPGRLQEADAGRADRLRDLRARPGVLAVAIRQ